MRDASPTCLPVPCFESGGQAFLGVHGSWGVSALPRTACCDMGAAAARIDALLWRVGIG